MKTDYVWYVCYGSNLLFERFSCYIKGGVIPGNTYSEKGAGDKSDPVEDKPTIINNPLFFSYHAAKWDGSGVAFIDPEKDENTITYCRQYLITKEQFIDVVLQENQAESLPQIDLHLEEAMSKGYSIISDKLLYGKIVFLGEEEQYPRFSFTCVPPAGSIERTLPNDAYLQTIIKGIKQTHKLTDKEIRNYIDKAIK